MKYFALLTLFALGACGIDGAPVKPSGNVGVSLGKGGISTSATVGASKGPFNVSIGL